MHRNIIEKIPFSLTYYENQKVFFFLSTPHFSPYFLLFKLPAAYFKTCSLKVFPDPE